MCYEDLLADIRLDIDLLAAPDIETVDGAKEQAVVRVATKSKQLDEEIVSVMKDLDALENQVQQKRFRLEELFQARSRIDNAQMLFEPEG